MTGLLKKDFRLLAMYGKILLLMMAIFLLTAVFMETVTLAAGVILIMGLKMTVNTISYDDMSHFSEYSVTLPVSRTAQVVEKYLFSCCILGIGAGIVAVLNLVFRMMFPESTDMVENVASTLLCMALGMVLISLMIPLVYKFGAEKARVLIILIGMSPALLIFLLAGDTSWEVSISERIIFLLFSCSPLIGLVFMIVSCLISIRIYQNKEF